jgi:hypothetical protein
MKRLPTYEWYAKGDISAETVVLDGTPIFSQAEHS